MNRWRHINTITTIITIIFAFSRIKLFSIYIIRYSQNNQNPYTQNQMHFLEYNLSRAFQYVFLHLQRLFKLFFMIFKKFIVLNISGFSINHFYFNLFLIFSNYAKCPNVNIVHIFISWALVFLFTLQTTFKNYYPFYSSNLLALGLIVFTLTLKR